LAAAPAAHAAASYIIVDSETGHILAEGNRNEKRQVASLTKVAAAMVVLDWAEASGTSLSTLVSVPSEVGGVGGVNPCQLQPGDQIIRKSLQRHGTADPIRIHVDGNARIIASELCLR
jgi:D-alanyl-D-alanine carboxypeptidase (penicillin-binding protein 5/6)